MQKLIHLKLEGDLKVQGFRVKVEIWEDSNSFSFSILSSLPPKLDLAKCLQQYWGNLYQNLYTSSRRIKPLRMTLVDSIEQQMKECKKKARELEKSLKNWIESETFSSVVTIVSDFLEPDDRIRLLIYSNDFDMYKLPWHSWYFFERYPNAEIVFGAVQLQHCKHRSETLFQNRVRILAIFGACEGIDIDADRRLLSNLPNAEISILVEPQIEQIHTALWEESWDIIFFAGHSETAGDRGIIYTNSHSQEKFLVERESVLWFCFKKAVERGLKLAIFNSCDGLGLAQQLEDLYVPQVIVMRDKVPDRVAHTFLEHFLRSFAEGNSLHFAMRNAREKLQELEDEFPYASWLPVMFQS